MTPRSSAPRARRTVPEQTGNPVGDLIRRALLDKRAELLSSLGPENIRVITSTRVGEEDQAQVFHDEFVALRLNSLGYEQLQMVEEAIDRLDAGNYGRCLACSKPIALLRLQAMPWARYCVICQSRVTSTGQEPVVRQQSAYPWDSRESTAPVVQRKFLRR